jgi:hypothetical protein
MRLGALPFTVEPVGVSVEWAERRDACPSSEGITGGGDGVRLERPAGLMVLVDSPGGGPHHPQAEACSASTALRRFI